MKKIIQKIMLFFICGMLMSCGQSGRLYLPMDAPSDTQKSDQSLDQ